MQGIDMGDMGMSQPQELLGFLHKLRQMWKMHRFSWLRYIFENMFLPEVPVWFILMLLRLLADGQLALLEGGSLNFVLPIEKHYSNLGGQVTYEATVENILVENDRAVGVHLADGSEHLADIVVSAADGCSTIFKMLDGRYVDGDIEKRYRNWKITRPLVMISFGVAHEFKGEASLNIIELEHPFTTGSRAIDGITVRIFNYSDGFAPPGKTVVEVMFETEWDWWNELQKDRKSYEAEKNRVANQVLERLEVRYPGISSHSEIIKAQIKKTLPGLENFYMAGQWATPGGGVISSLYSGRHLVQILCHMDEKPFSIDLQLAKVES